MPSVAIIAPGAMGSAVGRRLRDHGVDVVTVLDGRSAESVFRAREAGMAPVAKPELVQAGILLSIVPPGEAIGVAGEISEALAACLRKPLYVDCNAINPETAARVAQTVQSAGIDYVDAGIIGGPPKPGYAGPVFYLSGQRADEIAILADFGLTCRLLKGSPFAASALKMSYAGITKGLTALASMMILGASRAGVEDALRAELEQSQPVLLAWFERQIPSMFAKSGRWVAEMEEIASFLRQQPAAEDLFGAAAGFYAWIAGAAGASDVEALKSFFDNSKPGAGGS